MNKVMIVDDSSNALTLFKNHLTNNKYDIMTFNSAQKALEHLEKIPNFDCIISDYEMPEMNGPSFCIALKKNEDLKDIPVLILTANAGTNEFLLSMEAGANDFLSKDTDNFILAAKVSALINMKKMQEEIVKLRKFAAIKKIIALYNHEFNNPLAIAVGNLFHLQESLSDEKQIVRAQKIHEAHERMAAILLKIRNLRGLVE